MTGIEGERSLDVEERLFLLLDSIAGDEEDDKLTVRVPGRDNLRALLSRDGISSGEVIAKPMFVLVSGTSESGKSHFGEEFVKRNLGNRVKFYGSLARTQEYVAGKDTDYSEPFTYASRISNNSVLRDQLTDRIVDEYLALAKITSCPIFVVETIKHQWIIDAFKRRTEINTVSVFVDASFEKRVDREANKRNMERDVVAQETKEKDSSKEMYGSEEVRAGADLIIYNNGNLEEYNRLLSLLGKYFALSARYNGGTPKDFS